MSLGTVTIDPSENGDCDCELCIHESATGESIDIEDVVDNRQKLSDWHDHAHGLSLWAMCPHEPCRLLTDEFRRTS